MRQLAKSLFLILPCLLLLAGIGLCDDKNNTEAIDSLPVTDEINSVYQMAEMIYYETPEYPPMQEQLGVGGLVWLKVLVGEDGQVKEAGLYESSGIKELDESALKSSYKCRFNPAKENGRPVAMWVTYKVSFGLGTIGQTGVEPHISLYTMPREHGSTVDTTLRVLWDKPAAYHVGVDIIGNAGSDAPAHDFGILMLRQLGEASHSRKAKQKALVLINGGQAEGLRIGMTGTLPALDADGETVTLATATVTEVRPFESMCEIEISAGRTVTKYDYVRFHLSSLSEATQLERALDAYSKGDLELALAHLEKIAHLAESDPVIGARLDECREAVMSPPTQVTPEERESLDNLKSTHLAIAGEYYHLGDRSGAQRHLSKLLAVDTANPGAAALEEALQGFERCDSMDTPHPQDDRSEGVDRLPSMKVYVIPENPDDVASRSMGGGHFITETYHYKSGRVGVNTLVGTLGEIRQVEVGQTSGDSVLDRLAYESAFDSRFTPAILCGRPEPVWVSWDVVFFVR